MSDPRPYDPHVLKTLSYYKFKHSTFNLSASYIQKRMQIMDSGNVLTKPANIRSGVPRATSLALYYFGCLSMTCICILNYVTQVIMQLMQRFTQAVRLNLTLRPNYNMTEIKQNNRVNKTI